MNIAATMIGREGGSEWDVTMIERTGNGKYYNRDDVAMIGRAVAPLSQRSVTTVATTRKFGMRKTTHF